MIRGLPALKKAFRAATPELQAQFNEATEKTVTAVKFGAVQRVPVDTGALRDHIRSSFSPKTGFGRVGITSGGTVAIAGGRGVHPGVYGRYVHDGTVHQAARPFMLDAAEAERSHFAARLRAAGRNAERRIAAVGGRFV